LEGLDGFIHLQNHLNLLDVEELQKSGFREQWVSVGPTVLSSTTILLMLTGKLPIGVYCIDAFFKFKKKNSSMFLHVLPRLDKTV
jgi:hypothetical protein